MDNKDTFGETDLAKVVVSWLSDEGWDIYQEVQVFQYGKIADIVAKIGPVLRVVECKTSLSWKVVDQAIGWIGKCNQVCIAVPHTKPSKALIEYLHIKGIGLMFVSYRYGESDVKPQFKPTTMRRCDSSLGKVLCDAHRTESQAGAAGGGYWTPYKATCRSILETVKITPGICMKDLLTRVTHHYHSSSTAKQCIVQRTLQGLVPGVKCVREGRNLRFYPDDAKHD